MKTGLGFIGTGEMQSEILLKALLDDQVDAARDNPVEFVLAPNLTESMQLVYDYGLSHHERVDIVQLSSDEDILWYLDGYERAKLLVFWSEDDDEMKKVVKEALNQGLEVRDLCDALTRLGDLPDFKEPQMAVEEDTLYTHDDLAGMEEEEIAKVAESYGIDHEPYPEWDPVIDLILEAQDESMSTVETAAIESDPETMAALAEADAELAEDAVVFTLKELQEMESQALKDIVEANGLTPQLWDKTANAWKPAQRPRANSLIRAIWIATEGPFSGDGDPDNPENEPIELEGADGIEPEAPATEPHAYVAPTPTPSVPDRFDAVFTALDSIEDRFGQLLTALETIVTKMEDHKQGLGTLGRSVDNLTAEIKASTPQPIPGQIVPAKATGAIKKGLRRPGT